MRIRFYLDDDSEARGLVELLRNHDVHVATATGSGLRGARDQDHLAYATETGCVMCSANRKDFEALHREWMVHGKDHAGIGLVVQQRYSIGEAGRRLLVLHGSLSAEDMVNRIEYLGNWT